ncbi:MAG: F-box protein [Parachlamydiales bacterium]|nr:F-box protein [Parachlamydiales bacterium]
MSILIFMSIQFLPNDVLLQVFYNLDIQDVGRCTQVCKKWQITANTNKLWHSLAKKTFGYFHPVHYDEKDAKSCLKKESPFLDSNYKLVNKVDQFFNGMSFNENYCFSCEFLGEESGKKFVKASIMSKITEDFDQMHEISTVFRCLRDGIMKPKDEPFFIEPHFYSISYNYDKSLHSHMFSIGQTRKIRVKLIFPVLIKDSKIQTDVEKRILRILKIKAKVLSENLKM